MEGEKEGGGLAYFFSAGGAGGGGGGGWQKSGEVKRRTRELHKAGGQSPKRVQKRLNPDASPKWPGR